MSTNFMKEKLQRIKELYVNGGASEVSRGIKDFIYYRLFNRSTVDYHGERVDNHERWEYISSVVTDAESVIDIGCAEGFFTRRAAATDAFSLGIDYKQSRIQRARERSDSIDGCGFIKWDINPANVTNLPRVDTILFMTVHHHWEKAYELDTAEWMFQVVMDRCDVLVYEPPGDRPIIKNKNGLLDPADSLEYYTGRLKALYGDSIEIRRAQMFEHTEEFKNERGDPVFIIDTTKFGLEDGVTDSPDH